MALDLGCILAVQASRMEFTFFNRGVLPSIVTFDREQAVVIRHSNIHERYLSVFSYSTESFNTGYSSVIRHSFDA